MTLARIGVCLNGTGAVLLGIHFLGSEKVARLEAAILGFPKRPRLAYHWLVDTISRRVINSRKVQDLLRRHSPAVVSWLNSLKKPGSARKSAYYSFTQMYRDNPMLAILVVCILVSLAGALIVWVPLFLVMIVPLVITGAVVGLRHALQLGSPLALLGIILMVTGYVCQFAATFQP